LKLGLLLSSRWYSCSLDHRGYLVRRSLNGY